MKQRDQRKHRGASRPLKRTLHLSTNKVWTWRCDGARVIIRTPNCQTTYKVPMPEITHMSWDSMERGEWKGWWKGMGPQAVKDYIDRHLRPAPEFSVPAQLFVHPHYGAGWTWHLYVRCPFLPSRERHGDLIPKSVTPEQYADQTGELPTRRNLCGACMCRFAEQEAA